MAKSPALKVRQISICLEARPDLSPDRSVQQTAASVVSRFPRAGPCPVSMTLSK